MVKIFQWGNDLEEVVLEDVSVVDLLTGVESRSLGFVRDGYRASTLIGASYVSKHETFRGFIHDNDFYLIEEGKLRRIQNANVAGMHELQDKVEERYYTHNSTEEVLRAFIEAGYEIK